MKFAFAGAPEFAAWVLRDLVGLGRRPAVVISQPDRPRGRGRRAASPPAVLEAERLDLECWQAEDINSSAVRGRLVEAGVSTLVVAAFGQILRRPLLESLQCLNVHASLLPAYRGAAPIQRALAAGEDCTGVSIMRITEALDEGPWALRRSVSIGLHDDAASLGRVLALSGAVGVDQVLQALEDGTVTWTEQIGGGTYAGRVCASDCAFDPARGAKTVHDHVRSLRPATGARASVNGLQLKIWRTWPYGQGGLDAVPVGVEAAAGRPGRLVAVGERLFVGCGEGVVEILELQPAAKRAMSAPAFLRGYGGRLVERLDDTSGGACPTQQG